MNGLQIALLVIAGLVLVVVVWVAVLVIVDRYKAESDQP
jgi:hypothetical protein